MWIFIVSGLTFKYASVTAIIVMIMLIYSGFSTLYESQLFSMYLFWLLCSFTYGFCVAIIFELTRKSLFLNQRKLENFAVTDALTGLKNRRYFNHIINQEIAKKTPLALLMIDIDRFKQVNDSLGYQVGDLVIQKISDILTQLPIKNKILVRWGGDEFVIIIKQYDFEDLQFLCDEVRKTIVLNDFGINKNITISIGATHSINNDTQDSLLFRADKGLIQAKNAGRNRSIIMK